MKNEEHDDLWELLGRARPVKASPMFSRNVLRAVRQLESTESGKERGFMDWLRAGWNWLAVTGAAAAVLMLTFGLRTSPPIATRQVAAATPTDNAVLEKVLRSSDLTVIANLDLLVAMDDNDLWLDSKSR